MSNPLTFMVNWTTAIQNLVDAIEALEALNSYVLNNSALPAAYFETASGGTPNPPTTVQVGPRTDITSTDFAGSYQASQNMVAAFNATGQGGLANANSAYLQKMTMP